MRIVGLFEAKQKLSELVERARGGEDWNYATEELAAVLVPAALELSLKNIFRDVEKIRKWAKLRRGVNMQGVIEDGRA